MKLKLISCLLFIVLLPLAYSVSIGISPGRVDFNNLLKQGYAERTIRISTNSNDELTGHFEATGDIARWLSFSPNTTTFNMSAGKPYPLKIIINVPNDTRSDTYSGKIDFITDYFGNPSGRAGGYVKAGVTLGLAAIVTDKEIKVCRAGAFSINSIEIGDPSLEMSYTVFNDGNVRLKPKLKVDIFDQLQENLLFSEVFDAPEILPTVENQIIEKIITKNLGLGQYWARVSVDDCRASDLLTFSVLEKGAIVDEGILEKLTNKGWVYVDEPVEIAATFHNAGSRMVTAKFQGNVKDRDKIVSVLESEEIDVAAGDMVDLKTYFTPASIGRYEVTGRVIYNKKMTFERGSIINAIEKKFSDSALRYLFLLVYLIILITIIFLVRKIRKAKKKEKDNKN